MRVNSWVVSFNQLVYIWNVNDTEWDVMSGRWSLADRVTCSRFRYGIDSQ